MVGILRGVDEREEWLEGAQVQWAGQAITLFEAVARPDGLAEVAVHLDLDLVVSIEERDEVDEVLWELHRA